MSVITQAFSDAFQLLASGDEETFAAVQATLSTSGLAMLGCIIPGVPLGFLLGYTRFPGRNMLRILVDTALSFPTVVLGLLVYLLLARQGPFADFELLFTVPGIAIGLALLGTISGSLYQALNHEAERDAAIVTFLMTASGVTLLGIGSAFWGLVLGGICYAVFSRLRRA